LARIILLFCSYFYLDIDTNLLTQLLKQLEFDTRWFEDLANTFAKYFNIFTDNF